MERNDRTTASLLSWFLSRHRRKGGNAEPADKVRRIIKEDQDAGPWDPAQTQEEVGVGFDEIGEEAERSVGDYEEFEGVAREERRR